MGARMAARMCFGELQRHRDARDADLQQVRDAGGTTAGKELLLDCQLREQWRCGREDHCITSLVAGAQGYDLQLLQALAVAVQIFTDRYRRPAQPCPALGFEALVSRPTVDACHKMVRAQVEQSRAEFGDIMPLLPEPEPELPLPPIGSAAGASDSAGPAPSASGRSEAWAAGVLVALLQWRAVQQANLLGLLRQRRREEERDRLRRKYAAVRICRCARYWLRVLRPGRRQSWQWMPAWSDEGGKRERAALRLQCAHRRRLARRALLWRRAFCELRRRRARTRCGTWHTITPSPPPPAPARRRLKPRAASPQALARPDSTRRGGWPPRGGASL
jgi:hypothetical protein